MFFAIWWAWMNFTWFASSYDTDDVPYRLLTLLQMVGVLVLAAGVPTAMNQNDYRAVTIGYFLMRIGLIAQWVRASIEDPAGRRTARRYAAGISVAEVAWVVRLLLQERRVLPTGPSSRSSSRSSGSSSRCHSGQSGRDPPTGTPITSPSATGCSPSSCSARGWSQRRLAWPA